MEITKSFAPSNLADWRNWLAKNHDREREVWLVYFKAGSGKTNIDYESSVEEALCFGWIDSIIQKIDEEKYARKFNPRRMGSKWSETNKRRVLKVIREARMTKAGMAKITFDVNKVDISQPSPNVRLRRSRRL
jgi:uncharacterized protein YdeI (YjbR/CyaY-like superfamily)